MKQTLLACMLCCATWVGAQSIIPVPNDSLEVTGVATDQFEPKDVHIYVVNNTALQQTFTWGLMNYNTPTAWGVQLCDNNNCYDLLISPGPYESLPVAAGDTMDMKLQFVPACVQGVGTALVNIHITGDSAATSLDLFYKANLSATCINNVANIQANNLNVIPNPAKNMVSLTGLQNAEKSIINLYTFEGSLAETKTQVMSSTEVQISISDLPTGNYFITATDLLTGKTYTSKLIIAN